VVQRADVSTVRIMLAENSALVWADHLIHWECRVPGYHGHGGAIAQGDAKSEERIAIIRIFLEHGADPSTKRTPRYTVGDTGILYRRQPGPCCLLWPNVE